MLSLIAREKVNEANASDQRSGSAARRKTLIEKRPYIGVFHIGDEPPRRAARAARYSAARGQGHNCATLIMIPCWSPMERK